MCRSGAPWPGPGRTPRADGIRITVRVDKYRPPLGAYEPSDPTCAVRIESISTLGSIFLASRARQPVAADPRWSGASEESATCSLRRRRWQAPCNRDWTCPQKCCIFSAIRRGLSGAALTERRWTCRQDLSALELAPTCRGTSEEDAPNASLQRCYCSYEAACRHCQGRSSEDGGCDPLQAAAAAAC